MLVIPLAKESIAETWPSSPAQNLKRLLASFIFEVQDGQKMVKIEHLRKNPSQTGNMGACQPGTDALCFQIRHCRTPRKLGTAKHRAWRNLNQPRLTLCRITEPTTPLALPKIGPLTTGS